MRLLLLCVAAFASGCIEETESETETPVRETGYIECAVAADCDGDLRCIAADGTAECVDTGGGQCLGNPCECWAAQFCAQGDVCISGLDGFQCRSPESIEFALATVQTHGMCPVPGIDDQMKIGLVIGSADRPNLSEADRLEGAGTPLGDVLTPDDFAFSALPGRDFMGPEPATATNAEAVIGLTPTPRELEYDGAALPAERLLIMAVDHSGSLIGEDLVNGGVDISAATDIRDARIAFLRTVVGQLPSDTFLSLVSFQGRLPTVDPEVAVPTRNRDIIVNGLGDLESGTTGTTPLAATLTAIRETIVADNADLSASVLLFTDGVEDGDPSDPDRTVLDAEIEAFAAADIAVYVVQLRPPATAGHDRDRDPKLVELACRTGGEYIFVRDPQAFTDPRMRLAGRFVDRQAGVWRLTVDMPELAEQAAGWWAIATRLALQLGTITAEIDLRLSEDADRDFDDARLWLRRD